MAFTFVLFWATLVLQVNVAPVHHLFPFSDVAGPRALVAQLNAS